MHVRTTQVQHERTYGVQTTHLKRVVFRVGVQPGGGRSLWRSQRPARVRPGHDAAVKIDRVVAAIPQAAGAQAGPAGAKGGRSSYPVGVHRCPDTAPHDALRSLFSLRQSSTTVTFESRLTTRLKPTVQ